VASSGKKRKYDPHFHERQCVSKTRHSTRGHAEQSAKHRQRLTGNAIDVYQCQVCDGWHLAKAAADV
jgi:hypothetical protein